jgi:NAD(P)-dependent dehydrogenase (short-subunit alcohol dehydrogenase family)
MLVARFVGNYFFATLAFQWHKDTLQGTPWPRLGTSQDVAHCVLFLASPEAEWIMGIALPVDGGLAAK